MKNFELVKVLREKGYKISMAESCTGGLMAASIVDVAKASEVFERSYVTYANEAKIEILGVCPQTIQKVGVVSEEVALEMALGCHNLSKASVTVGISGIAGPTGGSVLKPVGTVCFGFYVAGVTKTCTCHFTSGKRNKIRHEAVEFAIDTLLEMLS